MDDRSLSAQQIRFVELIIDQLTARGFMEPSALYEAPFNSLHANGPEGLFAGKSNIINGIFQITGLVSFPAAVYASGRCIAACTKEYTPARTTIPTSTRSMAPARFASITPAAYAGAIPLANETTSG